MAGATHRGLFAPLMAGWILAACAGLPPNVETIHFASRDAVFLDDLMAGGATDPATSRRLIGHLLLPAQATAKPVPAAVILRSSGGPSALEWTMARELESAGIASLVVDSFGPRGIKHSGQDQTRITEATIMADAFNGLAVLAKDPRIRADRVAVIGFSKGAAVALYSATAAIAQAMSGPQVPRFAAHLAYYPWCGLNLYEPRGSGAPILIHMGEDDDMVSPAQCAAWVAAMRQADRATPIHLLLYPRARHGFNHPPLAYMPALTLSAQNSGTCQIIETAPGVFREASTGRPISHTTYRAVLADCLGHGGMVGYQSAAAELANGRSLSFLREVLLAP